MLLALADYFEEQIGNDTASVSAAHTAGLGTGSETPATSVRVSAGSAAAAAAPVIAPAAAPDAASSKKKRSAPLPPPPLPPPPKRPSAPIFPLDGFFSCDSTGRSRRVVTLTAAALRTQAARWLQHVPVVHRLSSADFLDD
jgi:hypothetical protein